MDISIINELLPGRKSVTTKLFSNERRNEILNTIDQHCLKNNQVYWVCPLVEESETLQLETAKKVFNGQGFGGIILTHAHVGHYTGLMYLGKEAANAKNVNVFAMPRMKKYLETNGPWSQLVTNKNISLTQIEKEQSIFLTPNLMATPFLVPHRDEYSETVGYRIKGPNKTALFIPDIDKWNKWDKSIVEEIKKVDYAFLDATFYSGKEINNRDISQIPHPFVIESLEMFKTLDSIERKKVIFIHFNHTNPALQENSKERKRIEKLGFRFANENDNFDL